MPRTFDIVRTHLAHNLRAARLRAGLSQEALAFESEVDRTYVSQIERGTGNPSVLVLVRLASALQVDAADLLMSSDRCPET